MRGYRYYTKQRYTVYQYRWLLAKLETCLLSYEAVGALLLSRSSLRAVLSRPPVSNLLSLTFARLQNHSLFTFISSVYGGDGGGAERLLSNPMSPVSISFLTRSRSNFRHLIHSLVSMLFNHRTFNRRAEYIQVNRGGIQRDWQFEPRKVKPGFTVDTWTH